jgi:hypothetical protein
MVTRLDIQFIICLCAHFQALPHCSHRTAVQQIFKYLKHTLEFGSSLICWSSRKQSSISQSTTEAEYVATATYCSQMLWIVQPMIDFGVIFERVSLMCDNTSAISGAKNPVFHKRMRHLERGHHFLKDHVEKGDIKMRYIDTDRQLADIFTKPLDASRFAVLWGKIGICYPYDLV